MVVTCIVITIPITKENYFYDPKVRDVISGYGVTVLDAAYW